MPYPKSRDEILELIMDALLDVNMCRDIVRRAGAWPASLSAGIPDIAGTFSKVTSDTGYAGSYLPATSFHFPDGTEGMAHYLDMRGVSRIRILVTTTSVGVAGSTLSIALEGGSFPAGAPTAPLDEIGLHVSEWCDVTPNSGAALVRWVVSNPSEGAGVFSVGLCQAQVR